MRNANAEQGGVKHGMGGITFANRVTGMHSVFFNELPRYTYLGKRVKPLPLMTRAREARMELHCLEYSTVSLSSIQADSVT